MLPPVRTRCSPGLRSPSGCSPLVQPAIEVPEQDPLVPGGDHRWCSRAIADLTRSSPWHWPGLFVENRTGLLQTCARLPTDTVAATFRGFFSCTLLHANAQKDTQADPPKTILIRLVAFFLYFGFQNTKSLRCCDRPPMSGHHAWPWVAEPPQFPARVRRLSYFYRRAKRRTKQRAQHRNRRLDLLP